MKNDQEYRQDARKILDGFEYKQLIRDDKNYIEVWRCKKPETTMYAFDIFVSRFGIAIVGDIDTLVFRVGYDYGIPFLAGKDVGYYIHSKLENNFKKSDFDSANFEKMALHFLCNYLCDSDKVSTKFPSFITEETKHDYDKIQEYVKAHYDDYVLASYIYDIKMVSNIEECYDFFQKYSEIAPSDWYEYSYTKMSSMLIWELFLINEAACDIMKVRG